MASGRGDRPLGTPDQEKGLLGLSSFFRTARETVNENATRYLTFGTELYKQGLIILNGNGANGKDGLYMFGSTGSTNLHVKAISAATSSSVNVTASGNTITIANASLGMMVIGIIMTAGNALPTASNTPPT